MKDYELKRDTIEIRDVNEVDNIAPGIVTKKEWAEPETIRFSYNKDELLEELKNYKSTVKETWEYYEVEEYWVEENEYNEDGEFVESSEILEFSEMLFTAYKDGDIPVCTSQSLNEILNIVDELDFRGIDASWENGRSELTVKDLREKANMSQSEFARYFGIPVRTLQGWEGGNKKAPDYVVNMMARIWAMEQE